MSVWKTLNWTLAIMYILMVLLLPNVITIYIQATGRSHKTMSYMENQVVAGLLFGSFLYLMLWLFIPERLKKQL